jgi:hypothetical protein
MKKETKFNNYYRNVFEFTPRLFLRCAFHVTLVPINVIVAVIVVVVAVLALSDWGPLEKQEMGTVITVTCTVAVVVVVVLVVNLMRVIVVVVSRRSYVDPLLPPLSHRSSEHRCRSVPSRGPSESGPNSFHDSLLSESPSDPSKN